MALADIRRRRFSLFAIRSILRSVRSYLMNGPPAYLVMIPARTWRGMSAQCLRADNAEAVIKLYSDSTRGMILISLTEHIQKLERFANGEVGLSQLQVRSSLSEGLLDKKNEST